MDADVVVPPEVLACRRVEEARHALAAARLEFDSAMHALWDLMKGGHRCLNRS